MIDTSRITSEFDIELHLGRGWFFAALKELADNDIIPLPPDVPPNTQISILDVQLVFDQSGTDLHITADVSGLILPVSVTFSITGSQASGWEIDIQDPNTGFGFQVPLGVGNIVKADCAKLPPTSDTDGAIAILLNIDLRASPQSIDPLGSGVHLERGHVEFAQSILPAGQDLALGIGSSTWPRFANDVWHGFRVVSASGEVSHPFPDSEKKKGNWKAVSIKPASGKIKADLVAKAKVDTPIVDIVPDPTVKVQVTITPRIDAGDVLFDVSSDIDVDSGILGDVIAFMGGDLIGWVATKLFGAPGSILGNGVVFTIEVVEYIVGEVIEHLVKQDPQEINSYIVCERTPPIVVLAQDQQVEQRGLSLPIDQATLRSIAIATTLDDPLADRTHIVTVAFDELVTNASGLGVSGRASAVQRLQAIPTTIVDTVRNSQNELVELVYEGRNGQRANLSVDEAMQRGANSELGWPFRLTKASDVPPVNTLDLRDPQTTLANVCLKPAAIRRVQKVVTDIRFDTGLELRVEESIALQKSGVLYLVGFNLIEPSNAAPHYRAAPNLVTTDNFENLPEFIPAYG